MSAIADIKAIQTILGVAADGIAGSRTEAAWDALKEAALRERQGGASASAIKVAVDAGHGMSNRSPGVYDPGCTHGVLEEADVALLWAKALVAALNARSIATFETRPIKTSPAPVGSRDEMAEAAGCTHFIAVHVNDNGPAAHGTETLFRDDERFAVNVHIAAVAGLKLTNRGVKQRMDLAVLNFQGQSCLIELGFIQFPEDVEQQAAIAKATQPDPNAPADDGGADDAELSASLGWITIGGAHVLGRPLLRCLPLEVGVGRFED